MDNQKEIERRRRRNINGHHLVLVPCPLQGHMSPMLHLAELLHSKGFFITIIISSNELNPPLNPSHYPEFMFQSINIDDDGIDNISYNSFGGDVMLYLLVLNKMCGTPFRDCLTKLQSSGSCFGTVSCVVYDAVMYFSAAIADELEIPRIVLRTSSASTFLALSLLRQTPTLNTKENDQLEQPQGDFPLLRAKDMPVFDMSDQEVAEEVLARIHHGTKTASAVIWNSLQCLEKSMFNKVEEKILAPIYPICPRLHYTNKHNFGANNNSFKSLLYNDDQSCIAWLDSQKPNSVLYVSTGSIVIISKSELAEMAWGLANSDQPFLWVVRPGLVNGSNGLELLPKGFVEITRIRGKVVLWAPQQRVLGHRSVGGFWTHNGWNSTIESVYEGVPMICWPRIGDQRVNARIVTSVWKVGIELEEKNLKRWKVERAIRKLMVDEEGEEIKKRALDLKEKVRVSLGQGGSSCEFLSKLVDQVVLMRK